MRPAHVQEFLFFGASGSGTHALALKDGLEVIASQDFHNGLAQIVLIEIGSHIYRDGVARKDDGLAIDCIEALDIPRKGGIANA